MTNTEDFYGLVPGAIGVLKYYGRPKAPSEDQIANAQNAMASSMFSSYLANYQFTKGTSQDMDPATAFMKARQKAREEAENVLGTTEQEFYVQIGQEESIKKMIELEQSEGFISWVDENMANLIKTTI